MMSLIARAVFSRELIRGILRPPKNATSVSLPFDADTPIRCYVESAYPAGIATVTRPLQGAILHFQLQLLFPRQKVTLEDPSARVILVPPIRLKNFEALGYVNNERSSMDLSKPLECIGHLISMLQAQQYPLLRVDSCLIQKTGSFLQNQYDHSHLLIGCDVRRRSFIGVAYGADGIIQTVRTPYYVLIQALKQHGGQARRSLRSTAFGISRRLQDPIPFNPTFAREQLVGYLSGSNNAAEYFSGRYCAPGSKPTTISWPESHYMGIKFYSGFKQYLRGSRLNQLPLDQRATRTLVEHKTVMNLVAEEKKNFPTPDPIKASLKQIHTLAQKIHFLCYSANSCISEHTETNILRSLDQLQRLEETTLAEWLNDF